MALVGPTLLTADPDTSNVASYATPSVSPTAGALILVGVRNTDGSNAIEPTLSSAFAVVGGTWTREVTAQNSTSVERVTLFSAVATGTPGSGAITADFGGDAQTGCIIAAVEYTGQDATDAVLQPLALGHSGAGVTSRTATLAGALGSASNQVLAFISHNVNEDQTAGGGGTELASSDVGYDTPGCRQGVYYEVGDNSVSASWASSSRGSWVACEVVAATGGAAYDLDCQPGAVAVTGAAASPIAARLVSALAGTFAVTGAVASPVAGRVVSADPGAYAVTGSAATPLAARTINAETGAYTFTGADAGTLAGRSLNTEPGVFTLTGVQADLVYTPAPGEYVLDCQAGSFTVAGAAATVGRTLTLDAGPGGYSVTGNAATFARTLVLNASPATYVLTGTAAELAVQVQEPTLDPILTGWIASPTPGRPGGGGRGRIRVPSSGRIA